VEKKVGRRTLPVLKWNKSESIGAKKKKTKAGFLCGECVVKKKTILHKEADGEKKNGWHPSQQRHQGQRTKKGAWKLPAEVPGPP